MEPLSAENIPHWWVALRVSHTVSSIHRLVSLLGLVVLAFLLICPFLIDEVGFVLVLVLF